MSRSPFPESVALDRQRLRPPLGELHVCEADKTDRDSAETYVPGEPCVPLDESCVHRFLLEELSTPLLDELYPNLWLVGRKYSGNIDSLHRQNIKERAIIPAEDPKLHLIWRPDKIYIKPIPLCLLNHGFWDAYLASPVSIGQVKERGSGFRAQARSAALGFMRSYSLLVRHRLDFVLAQETYLIPQSVNWTEWSRFIAHFRVIKDDEVDRRYHYGQLRLSRLNWIVRIFQPQTANTKWFYEIPHWSIMVYLRRASIPLAFAFASLSVTLASMQVVLAVPGLDLTIGELGHSATQNIAGAFLIFSIAILIISGMVWILILAIPGCTIASQVVWGWRNRKRQQLE